MTKIRKQKKKKTFVNSINRKRLRNRIDNVGNIKCLPIKRAWNEQVSARTNLREMGLAYDPNEVLKIPSYKQLQTEKALAIKSGDFYVTDISPKPSLPTKINVAEQLEAEAKAPRQTNLRLPRSHIETITYFMDKYGHDYKAMTRDRKNYYQETWKQLRAKVKKFMGMPKEYGKYLKTRGLLDKDLDEDAIKKEAEALEMNDSD